MEAGRIKEGSLFFLVDPANPYQISYYRAVSLEKDGDGFVHVSCETPDVDEIIYYYEAEDQVMVMDPSTLELYNGAEVQENISTREISGDFNTSLGINFEPEIELGPIKIKASVGYSCSFKGSYKIGLFVQNSAEIEQKTKQEMTFSLSSKAKTKDGEISDVKKEIQSLRKYMKDISPTKSANTYPVAHAVLWSWAGIINITYSAAVNCEFSGEISLSVKHECVTTYTYKEGEAPKKSVDVTYNNCDGSVEAEMKFGIFLSLDVYLTCVKVLSAGLFAGIEVKAKWNYTSAVNKLLGMLEAFEPGTIWESSDSFNWNMMDCVEITVSLVIEIELKAGVTDSVTIGELKSRIVELKLYDIHFHFLFHVFEQEMVTGGEDEPWKYQIRLGEELKDKLHLAYDCPYDTKSADFIFPWNKKTVRKLFNLIIGTQIADPEIEVNPVVYRRKFVAWHDSPSLDEESTVTWPYTITEDTKFYAETVPMHQVIMIDASKTPIAVSDDVMICEEGSDTGISYNEREKLMAEGEQICLPETMADGTPILKWIEIQDLQHLTPKGEDMDPGTAYTMSGSLSDDEDVWLCALTDKDVAAYFYNDMDYISDTPYIPVYAARGSEIEVPQCSYTYPGYSFKYWQDEDSDNTYLPGDIIQTDENTPTILTFRAYSEYDGSISAEQLDEVAIGGTIPISGTYTEDPDIFRYRLNEDNESLTVTGFVDGKTAEYSFVKIPETVNYGDIGILPVTAVGNGAFEGCTNLQGIYLSENIQTIGNNAFEDCTALMAINLTETRITEIPDYFAYGCTSLAQVLFPVNNQYKVTRIGSCAFTGCESVRSIRIDADIENSAFSGCAGLKSVTLGAGVTSVGNSAFYGCTSLTELSLPDSVTSIGDNFVKGCTKLKTLEIAGAVNTLTKDMMCIGSSSVIETVKLGYGTEYIRACFTADNGYATLKNITLPSSIKTISSGAFSGSGLESLTLSFSSSTNITGAFKGCSSLKEITVLSGKISSEAFSDLTSLETVTIGASVSSIGDHAFSGCTSLTDLTIEEGVRIIESYAFSNNTSLESAIVPDSVISYGTSIFYGCSALKSLSVGKGINNIDLNTYNAAFCIGQDNVLEELIIREGVSQISCWLFSNGRYTSNSVYYARGFSSLKTLTLPSTLTKIGEHAFAGAGITTLTLNGSVELLNYAFTDCPNLEEFIFNKGEIGYKALENNQTLKKVVIRNGNIGRYAFNNCPNLTDVTVEDGVQTIGDYAFANCTSLEAISFPDSVTEYGRYIISGDTALKELTVGGGVSVWGYNQQKNDNTTFQIGSGSSLRSIVLRDGIQTIGQSMFRDNTELESVIFPESVTTIGVAAFYNTAIRSLDIPGIVSIEDSAFEKNQSLASIKLNGGTIGEQAFYNCTALTEVDLGEVTEIDDEAFRACTSLQRMTVPDSVTLLEYDFLKDCTSISYLSIGSVLNGKSSLAISDEAPFRELEIREGVYYIGARIFKNKASLEIVSFPDSLIRIGDEAFRGTGIKNLSLSGSISIGEYAFADCKQLLEVEIEEIDTLTNSYSHHSIFYNDTSIQRASVLSGEIPAKLFMNCTGLKEVDLGPAVTSIGANAFYGCSKLESLDIPDSVTTIGDYIIQGCTDLRELRIGGGTTILENEMFYVGEGAKLEHIQLGEGIIILDSYVFANTRTTDYDKCLGFTELKTINFPASLTQILGYVIAKSRVASVIIPGNVEVSINAFRNLDSLIYVSVAGGTIGRYAFAECPALKNVVLGENVTKLDSGSFSGDISLAGLYLPDSLISIGTYSTNGVSPILGCTGIKTLSVGAGFESFTDKAMLFRIGPDASLEVIEFREGVRTISANTFRNYVDNTVNGLPSVRTIFMPQTLVSIEDNNLRYVPNLTSLYLKYGSTMTETGEVPSGLAIYSDYYNANINRFAVNHDLEYIVCSEDEVPGSVLTLMIETENGFETLSQESKAFAELLMLSDPEVSDGYSFGGWYMDPDFTVPVTLTRMPLQDLTLYAHVIPLIQITYAINVASEGTSGTGLPSGFYVYDEVSITRGETIPLPQEPSPAGYVFLGWYSDPDYRFAADFVVAPEEDTVIYASLKRLSAGARFQDVEGGVRLVSYVLEEDESKAVELPAKVNGKPLVSIASGAFAGSGVSTLKIPDSVTDIPEGAFTDSGIKSITVSAGNESYSSAGGVLYNKDKTTILYYPSYLSRYNSSFTLPSTVTRVGKEAFAGNTYIKSISFNNVVVIGEYAFRGCTGITQISLSSWTTTLEAGAFEGCYGLSKFTAYGLAVIETITSDGTKAQTLPTYGGLMVYGPLCEGVLREYYLIKDPDGTEYTLNYNSYKVTLHLGNKTEVIYQEAGMLLTDYIRDAKLEDGTVITGWYKNSSLTTAWDMDNDTMPTQELNLYASFTPLFEYEYLNNAEVAEGITVTGYGLNAFNGNETDIVIPSVLDVNTSNKSIVALLSGFLSGKQSAGNVTIPSSVVYIADDALVCADGSLPASITGDPGSAAEAWALEHDVDFYPITYKLSFITYGEELNDRQAAKGTQIYLPVPVRAGRIFAGWYTSGTLSEDTAVVLENDLYTMPGADTVLYAAWEGEDEPVPFTWSAKGGNVTIISYTGDETKVVIPDTINGFPVTAIAEEAFADHFYLNTCIIPDTVTSIGDRAFAGTSVSSIAIPDSVTDLGTGVFQSCEALRSVTIGSGVDQITPDLFYGCRRLTRVDISEDNQDYSSADGVIFDAGGTELIYFPAAGSGEYRVPDGVMSIGESAFYNASGLTGIDLNNVTRIENSAFMACRSLSVISLADVTYIGEKAFYGCRSLTEIELSPELAFIGEFAFMNCNDLTNIIIPAGVILDTGRIYFSAADLMITGTVGTSAQEYAYTYGIAFNDPNAASVTDIILNNTELEMERGDITVLTAAVSPADAEIGTGISWYSSDNNVVLVQEGTVSAVGNGKAIIYAITDTGLTASCNITVTTPVKAVIPYLIPILRTGDTTTLSVRFNPANPSDKTVTWSSSDNTVASVNGEGVITAVSGGTAVITVTASNGVSASVNVTVLPAGYQDTCPEISSFSNVLSLPAALTVIEDEAFEGDSSIMCIVLGQNVTTIGSYAFSDMDNLAVIVIPDSVSFIAENAFLYSDPIIRCEEGSYAESYAILYGLKYYVGQ